MSDNSIALNTSVTLTVKNFSRLNITTTAPRENIKPLLSTFLFTPINQTDWGHATRYEGYIHYRNQRTRAVLTHLKQPGSDYLGKLVIYPHS